MVTATPADGPSFGGAPRDVDVDVVLREPVVREVGRELVRMAAAPR